MSHLSIPLQGRFDDGKPHFSILFFYSPPLKRRKYRVGINSGRMILSSWNEPVFITQNQICYFMGKFGYEIYLSSVHSSPHLYFYFMVFVIFPADSNPSPGRFGRASHVVIFRKPPAQTPSLFCKISIVKIGRP